MLAKSWIFFSELPNPRSTSGETIQNSLNYCNRKQGLLICSIVERIDFFVHMKKIMKKYLKFTKKTWKNHGNIMEFC